jgi:hypothetical protein
MDPLEFFTFLEGDYNEFELFFNEVGADANTWRDYFEAKLFGCAEILSRIITK